MEITEQTIVLDKPVGYDLEITMVALTWYGRMVGGIYKKYANANKMDEIRKDPLQDYVNFGFQAVLCVDIQIYPEYVSGYYRISSMAPKDNERITAWKSGAGYDRDKVVDLIDEMNEDLYKGNLTVERIR